MYSVLAGYNVALLAPTEMLAKQHMEVFQNLLSNLNKKLSKEITAELLISKTKAKTKLYERLLNREVNIIIADFHDDFCTIRRDMISEKILISWKSYQ